MRILVAEDDECQRQMMIEILVNMHHEVVAVADGHYVLERLEANEKCDLVITDNRMPKLSGIEVLRKIHSDDRWRDLPVIVNSADYLSTETIQKLGGRFVSKLDPTGLTNAIKEIEKLLKH